MVEQLRSQLSERQARYTRENDLLQNQARVLTDELEREREQSDRSLEVPTACLPAYLLLRSTLHGHLILCFVCWPSLCCCYPDDDGCTQVARDHSVSLQQTLDERSASCSQLAAALSQSQVTALQPTNCTLPTD